MLTRVLLRKLAKEAQEKRGSRLPSEITEIKIDTELPEAQRKQQYLEDAENPYLLRSGSIQITAVYSADGLSLSDLLADYFSRGGAQE
ncbi:DUF6870 family protein [Oscillibacter sp. GMB15532]|uniref:DUF6870 family protein n=1 Tax=Oscillibacter sp. GMB15532 TaxID=3230022 RepID=UPI0034DFA522